MCQPTPQSPLICLVAHNLNIGAKSLKASSFASQLTRSKASSLSHPFSACEECTKRQKRGINVGGRKGNKMLVRQDAGSQWANPKGSVLTSDQEERIPA